MLTRCVLIRLFTACSCMPPFVCVLVCVCQALNSQENDASLPPAIKIYLIIICLCIPDHGKSCTYIKNYTTARPVERRFFYYLYVILQASLILYRHFFSFANHSLITKCKCKCNYKNTKIIMQLSRSCIEAEGD